MRPEQHVTERRMSPRIPTALGLHVYAYGALVASGISIDLSEHGLLMRIERDLSTDELDPGKHLDIKLEYGELISEERWLPIKVVRKWDGGIAARFIGVAMRVE